MTRKIVSVLVLLPLAMLIVMLSVANRHVVTLSLDPFSTDAPAYAGSVPLYCVILVSLIAGALSGGTASWLRQGRWRRAARRSDAELRKLRAEVHAMRRELAAGAPAGLPTVAPRGAIFRRPPAA
jgi:uncharacterized integral membrane protein